MTEEEYNARLEKELEKRLREFKKDLEERIYKRVYCPEYDPDDWDTPKVPFEDNPHFEDEYPAYVYAIGYVNGYLNGYDNGGRDEREGVFGMDLAVPI